MSFDPSKRFSAPKHLPYLERMTFKAVDQRLRQIARAEAKLAEERAALLAEHVTLSQREFVLAERAKDPTLPLEGGTEG